MTEAELDDIHKRLRDDKNATADRRYLLAEIDRLNSEIDEWRARWKEAQQEIKRLEGRD